MVQCKGCLASTPSMYCILTLFTGHTEAILLYLFIAMVIKKHYVGFKVLTAMVMKSSNLWDIMLCSPLKVNRRFRGTRHFHLQGQETKHETYIKQVACSALFRKQAG
jgi:hypothetical protein